VRTSPFRGLKYGFVNALLLVAVLATNHWLRGERIEKEELASGAILAFITFGIINTFTDKIGSDFGG